MAADTVKLLAKFQGTKIDHQTAEQPGKILHEVRRAGISPDPNAGIPALPPIYYGTIDVLAEGPTDEARTVAEGLLDAARRFDMRLPELFGGEEGRPSATPMPYPASCRPQAWAAASAVIIARALS